MRRADGNSCRAHDPPSSPVVSVIIVTYRHEAFITQAVESVLAQQTDFPIEILISEDCSPERTREIVIDLQRRYPETIRLFLSEHNQNNNVVITRAWEAARGKYIAVLDGDDYWTDPLKLQKQVEFLERHPDIFVCGHAVTVVDEDGKELEASQFDIHEDRYPSREDLAWGYFFPFLSVLFRNNKTVPPHTIFNDVFNTDSFMLGFFANFGAGYLSREVMGTYREHPGGAWSTLDARRAVAHRNATLSRIPLVLSGSLKPIAYAKFLSHLLREDDRWSHKLHQIPHAVVMMLVSLTPHAAAYLVKKVVSRVFKRA